MKAILAAMTVGIAMTTIQVEAQGANQRAHEETRFQVVVHAPYTEAAALFGPLGEREWAGKHWDPQFIFPAPGRDEEGGVFTIQRGLFTAVWVTALHEVAARHLKYVYFIPGLMVTTIDVRFETVDAQTTNAHVTYARTAITPEGDEHVAAMTEADRRAGAEWQSAIDRYLASRRSANRR